MQVDNLMREAGLIRTARPQDASIFFVNNMVGMPKHITWNAVLCGGVVCPLQRLTNRCGPMLCYKSALRSRRLVFMTDAFIAAHGNLCTLLLHRLSVTKPCNWRFTEDIVHFTRRAAAAKHEAVALVTPKEQASAEWSHIKLTLTAADALVMFTTLEQTIEGICGR